MRVGDGLAEPGLTAVAVVAVATAIAAAVTVVLCARVLWPRKVGGSIYLYGLAVSAAVHVDEADDFAWQCRNGDQYSFCQVVVCWGKGDREEKYKVLLREKKRVFFFFLFFFHPSQITPPLFVSHALLASVFSLEMLLLSSSLPPHFRNDIEPANCSVKG